MESELEWEITAGMEMEFGGGKDIGDTGSREFGRNRGGFWWRGSETEATMPLLFHSRWSARLETTSERGIGDPRCPF